MSYGYRSRESFRPRHAESKQVTPPTFEPLELAEAKLRAGLDWDAGDPRDVLMVGFIKAARDKVERDTGIALAQQTRDLFFDVLPTGWWTPIDLPPLSTPLQSVSSILWTNCEGFSYALAASDYAVDLTGGRIGFSYAGAWPGDLRPFQPWRMRIVSGYARVNDIPPLLVHAVGLMVAHYATYGRDLVGGALEPVPFGYEDAIAPYVIEALA